MTAPLLVFACTGVPRPQGSKKLVRDKRSGKTRMIDVRPDALEKWRDAVGWAAKLVRQPGAKLLAGPLRVELEFRFLITKPERMGEPHSQKPDVDKLIRAVLDSLTGIVWVDDCQVVSVAATKRWSSLPGVEVEIRDWSGA